MAGRFSRFALLLWTTVWMGVILPGHTRGTVATPGSPSGRVKAASISAPASCCSRKSAPKQDQDAPIDRGGSGKCALCYVVATMLTPAPVDLVPRPGATTEIVQDGLPQTWTLVEFLDTSSPRAPPTA